MLSPIESIVRAYRNPTAVNIIKALTPIGTIECAMEKIVAAVNDPSVENIERVLVPPIGPRPSQVYQYGKELIAVSDKPKELLNKAVEIGLRETVSVPIRFMLYQIVEGYVNDLQRQAEGKWKELPPELIQAVKDYYKVDLTQVRYAENIVTTDPTNAVAFPKQIFFPRSISPLTNKNDLHWLLHELTHQDQYQAVGGLRNFLDNYSTDIVHKVIQTKSFDVHGHLEYEKEADQRADQLLDNVWAQKMNLYNSLELR